MISSPGERKMANAAACAVVFDGEAFTYLERIIKSVTWYLTKVLLTCEGHIAEATR